MSGKKKFSKTLALILLSAVMAMAGTFGAMAETIGNSTGWERTAEGGWRYIKSDGHMAADEWIWIGEEATGYRCYFFDGSGNLVTNAITVDNQQVNSSGAWVVNGEEQVRMFVDTTRPPFGNEVTNGYTVPTITLSTYLTSLLDVRSSASGFPNRKYICTMDDGDVLFYTTNNDIQIKIRTDGDMVVGVEAPCSLIFSNMPENGIELNALLDNMAATLSYESPIEESPENLAIYFEIEPYSFISESLAVVNDRTYDVSICLSQGRDGRYYVFPSNLAYMKLHVNINDTQSLGPGVQ